MHLGGAMHRQYAGMKTIHMAQILASTQEPSGTRASVSLRAGIPRLAVTVRDGMPHPVLDPALAPPFPQAALPVLRNTQLRKNVAHAIDVIQAKRARLVAEKTDWQELRAAAAAIRDEALAESRTFISSNLKSGARRRAARCTGRRMRPKRGGSFSRFCGRKKPTRSSRSRR